MSVKAETLKTDPMLSAVGNVKLFGEEEEVNVGSLEASPSGEPAPVSMADLDQILDNTSVVPDLLDFDCFQPLDNTVETNNWFPSCNNTKKSPFHESVTSDYSSTMDLGDIPSPGSLSNHGDEDGMEYAAISFDELLDSFPETHLDDGNSESAQGAAFDGDSCSEVDVESSADVDIESLIKTNSNTSVPKSLPVFLPNSTKQSAGGSMVTRSSTKFGASKKINVPIPQGEVVTRIVKVIPASKPRSDSQSCQDDPEFITEKNRKAAIQARINRQKKKHYIQGLEEQISDLAKENDELKVDNQHLLEDKTSLEEEVEYLKSVLANQSALSGLLKNIGNVQSVSLSSSFMNSRKRSVEADHDYPQRAKKRKNYASTSDSISGGVCLHVENENVSLEFCSKCAKMAKGASRGDKS